MSKLIEISDDEDSFTKTKYQSISSDDRVLLSSDSDTVEYGDVNNILTDDDDDEKELPEASVRANKKNIINKLFPSKDISPKKTENIVLNNIVEDDKNNFSNIQKPSFSKSFMHQTSGVNKMIGGISVNMPVEPYGCQIALISKIITAIKTKKNCLLESPTGSGKTLALLCGALAWQRHEKERVGNLLSAQQTGRDIEPNFMSGAGDSGAAMPTINFNKTTFGEKSIYDSPRKDKIYGVKRTEPLDENLKESTEPMVTIHEKKRRLNWNELDNDAKTIFETPTTSEKPMECDNADNSETYSIPTIYYGARTHKQLQQVIKEFKRTSYCGEMKMTVLSSREYSCIREFDKSLWSTKNDMCRGCVKSYTNKEKGSSNCKYFDNRLALNHKSLPPAFDLEELVKAGEKKSACPYYAARNMAASAHIVFCPYNYLIEPSIRNSMQIDLRDNVVVIDEAHNIEDICRDSATFSFTRHNIQAAITELEKVAGYMFTGQDVSIQVDYILKTLQTWDNWFVNQLPLLDNKPANENEEAHLWEAGHFVQTLDNHNIGRQHYPEFKKNAEAFCQRLREDPRTLYGVSQATGTLVENIDTALSYLFRCDCQYMDDFKPALVRMNALSEGTSWRSSQFNKGGQKEILELRLMCMNPAIVFGSLLVARCLILASGTLTPLISLHSELGAEFPLRVTPNHVIPADRVWVGTLQSGPGGEPLECRWARGGGTRVQDALGAAVLRVARVTPAGLLCFTTSYRVQGQLVDRWRTNGVWEQLQELKYIFIESKNVRDHNDIMEDYYKYSASERGAILFAVFRGKVSEGMDFRDHQARAVITIGIPYPNTFDMAVKEKMKYNNKYEKTRNLLSSNEWLRVQAYRALNQAVGRCVRHRADWGAVLMVDCRFHSPYYTEHLSKWVKNFLGNNHHTLDSLFNSSNSIESFMQNMKLKDEEGNV